MATQLMFCFDDTANPTAYSLRSNNQGYQDFLTDNKGREITPLDFINSVVVEFESDIDAVDVRSISGVVAVDSNATLIPV